MSFSADKIAKLRKLSAGIKRLPKVVAKQVAQNVDEAITEAARETFEAGQDPYGTSWKPGKDGQAVTLRKSGALERGLKYVAAGVRIRARLGVRYAKYQIGKRQVFPRKGQPLPASYTAVLKAAASVAIKSLEWITGAQS